MKKTIAIITIGIFALIAPQTQAALIEIAITAEVTDMDDPGDIHLGGNVNIGDTIIGKYVYDSDAIDSEPSLFWGVYEFTQSPYGIFLEVGGIYFETDPTNVDCTIGIANNDLSSGRDIFGFESNNNLSLSNATPINNIYWQLSDYSESALSSDELPLTAPILNEWSNNRLTIEGGERNWIST